MKNEKTRKITKNNRIILTPLTLFMLNTTPLLCEVVTQLSVGFIEKPISSRMKSASCIMH